MSVTFVLGGARSGKTAYAEKLAAQYSLETSWPVVYIATGQAFDAEMEKRIERHRQQRPGSWSTLEEPLHLERILDHPEYQKRVLLVDCLSLLVNNWMFQEEQGLSEDEFFRRQSSLIETLKRAPQPVILVSNEVGTGIVPDNALSRQYRDYLGWLNQAVAACAKEVYWLVAGVAVALREGQAPK